MGNFDKTAERNRKRNERIKEQFVATLISLSEAKEKGDRLAEERAFGRYCGLRNAIMIVKPNGRWQEKINQIYRDLKDRGYFKDEEE